MPLVATGHIRQGGELLSPGTPIPNLEDWSPNALHRARKSGKVAYVSDEEAQTMRGRHDAIMDASMQRARVRLIDAARMNIIKAESALAGADATVAKAKADLTAIQMELRSLEAEAKAEAKAEPEPEPEPEPTVVASAKSQKKNKRKN